MKARERIGDLPPANADANQTEKARLEAKVHEVARPTAAILPHPALPQLFAQKDGALRETLDDAPVRTEAAQVLALIGSVTIHPDPGHGPKAEVVAKVSDLVAYATNDTPKGGDCSSKAVVAGAVFDRHGTESSTAVVAGTGFEPVTFRL